VGTEFKPGDRVLWTDVGRGTLQAIDGAMSRVKLDEDRDNDIVQDVPVDELAALVPLTVDDCAIVQADPTDNPFGFIITEDGTTYALRSRFYHGVLLAVLFPDVAHAQGYEPPMQGDANVYLYQRFELDNHRSLPVIRVAFGMMTPVNVSKGDQAATPAQIAALSKVFRACGIGLNDQVATDLRDMTARSALREMGKAA